MKINLNDNLVTDLDSLQSLVIAQTICQNVVSYAGFDIMID